jgi:thiamine pyrophosphokinase
VNEHAPHIHAALLLCNGEPPSKSAARAIAEAVDLVVAADGGANSAAAVGVQPDVIIGDLDSVKPSVLRKFHAAEIIRVRRQDNTDLEKALDYLQHLGVCHVYLMGATGRRLDMTLANLTVLWRYAKYMDIVVVGTGWSAVPVTGSRRLTTEKGMTVSLIPYSPCSGVTLRGLKYPLTNATWKPGEVAVSNVVLKKDFSVVIKKGRALLIVSDPSASSSGKRR